MADSKRKQIIVALRARLEEIKTADGYLTEAGEHVSLGPLALSADDPLPQVGLVPAGNELVDKNLDNDETRRWSFSVEGALKNDDDAVLTVEDLIGDIKRAIFRKADVILGGLALEVESVAGETATPPQEGGTIYTCAVPVVVRYVEEYGGS